MKTHLKIFNIFYLCLLGICVFTVLFFFFRVFTQHNIFFTIPSALILTYLHQKGQNLAIKQQIKKDFIFYGKNSKVKTFNLIIKGKCLFFMITEFAFYFGSFCFLTSEIMIKNNIHLSLNLFPILLIGLVLTYIYSRFKTAYKFNFFLL